MLRKILESRHFNFCCSATEYLHTCNTLEEAWNNCVIPAWMQSILSEIGLYRKFNNVAEIFIWAYGKEITRSAICDEIRNIVPFDLVEKTLIHVHEKRIADATSIAPILISDISTEGFCLEARDYLATHKTILSAWRYCRVPTWMRHALYAVDMEEECDHVYKEICARDTFDSTGNVYECCAIREYVSVVKLSQQVRKKLWIG